MDPTSKRCTAAPIVIERPSQIFAQLDRLSCLLNDLETQIKDLGTKLSPVLNPNHALPNCGILATPHPKEALAPLAESIESKVSKLKDAIIAINNIQDNVEL